MDVYLQLIIVCLFSLFLFIIFLQKWSYRAVSKPGRRLPPSPRKLPIIGNLHHLGELPHRSLHSLSKHYGHLMLLHFGSVPVLIASSAATAEEIMKNQDLIFSNRPKLSLPDKLMYGSHDVAFAPYGEYWRQVRSICVLHLLSNKRVQSFRRIREEETSIMVERIAQLGSSSSSFVVNLSNMMISVTNDVICRVALGRKYGEDNGDRTRWFKNALMELRELLGTSSIGDYIPWLAWMSRVNGLDARVKRVVRFLDKFLDDVLQEHRERKKPEQGIGIGDYNDEDFVDILLKYQKENGGESTIKDDTIKALILDMFFAGTDATVSVLDWAMAELVRNPITMKKLQIEVRKTIQGNESICEGDLEKMPYLKSVIKESLRLHVPTPLLIVRESTQDTQVMGFHILVGTQVIINAWAISRDPLLWEDPEKFHPERFLNTTTDFRGRHFQFIPFGAGRRGCPGIAFAVTVEELVLAKLVHKFNFALPNGGKPEDLDMSESHGINVQRKFPLFLSVTSC